MPASYRNHADHYRDLLARHYSWMFGMTFDEKVMEQRAILEPVLEGAPRGLAADLGCGPGFQSLALIQLGFNPVQAIDTSGELLSELASVLRERRPGLPVDIHCADMLGVGKIVPPETASAIVCMGDTLTHLTNFESVRRLFRMAADTLAPGGLFVLTWRDLTAESEGLDRFIPVRSDESTVMTCFLEYTSPTTVVVHDLVYTRNGAGWTFEKSSYQKLRLASEWVRLELAAAGFELLPPRSAGRLCVAAGRKP